MSQQVSASAEVQSPTRPAHNYLNHETSLWSWLSTVDHKRIGLLYGGTLVITFLLGGIMALLVRAELIAPGQTIMDANTYNQVFSMHGIIMVFLFLVPSIPAVLGNFALPMHLGAVDVAFPRLNLASWYVFPDPAEAEMQR